MTVSARRESATCDEAAHLAAGFSYLTTGDFRLNPEHPPLAKALAAVPLVLAGARAPAPSASTWDAAATDLSQEWQYGHDFLYENRGGSADRILFLGRLPMIALALVLGVLIWICARDLWGERVAAIAVALWALEPNLLANGPLIATDVGVTVFTFGACYFLWRCCRELTIANAAGLAAFVALAVATKYSAVLLAPALVAALAIRVGLSHPWPVRLAHVRVTLTTRWRQAVLGVAMLLVLTVSSVAALWIAYGFRYHATRDGRPMPTVAALQGLASPPSGHADTAERAAAWALAAAARVKVVPEACILGFASMLRDAHGRPSYALGELATRGHWWYFPLALGIKVPLPILILALLGAVALARRRLGPALGAASVGLVFVPPVAFLAVAMTSQLNLGIRHVLPVFPFLLLLAAAGAASLWQRRWGPRRIVAAALAIWLVIGAARAFPHFLAYFNEIAGRDEDRVHWLADSNLDWGQDLPGLRDFMRARGIARINLCYFGNADPRYYGIDFVGLPGSWGVWDERSPSQPELPGYLAISATNLAGVGLRTPQLRTYYARLLEHATLVDTIGSSIFVYYLAGR